MRATLLLALVADLTTMAIVTIAVSADAATALQLHSVAVALGGALAGATIPGQRR